MQCTIKELRSHWIVLNRQLTLHDRIVAARPDARSHENRGAAI